MATKRPQVQVKKVSVGQVVRVSSSEGRMCEACNSESIGLDRFAESINHYLGHGYHIVHVGQETVRDDSGALRQSTVAILGIEREALEARGMLEKEIEKLTQHVMTLPEADRDRIFEALAKTLNEALDET
jgi:hypothetical protein